MVLVPVYRNTHYTDYHCGRASGVVTRKRIITPWLNYQEPAYGFKQTAVGSAIAQSVPNNWSGTFDFTYQSIHAPLQIFVEDSTDSDNTAMVGVVGVSQLVQQRNRVRLQGKGPRLAAWFLLQVQHNMIPVTFVGWSLT